jgi:hypothetical protein
MIVYIDIDEKNARALSLYLKRITYEDAFRRTDSGYTDEARKEQAYRFLDGVINVEKSINEELYKQRNTPNQTNGIKR